MNTGREIISAFPAEGLTCLFPDENGAGLSLSQQRIKALSRSYSALYLAMIAELAPEFSRETGVARRVADLVLREALVSPLHCFIDRLLRLEEFGRRNASPAVAAAPPARDFDDAAAMRAAAQDSVVFNAGLLAEHAALLGWPTVPAQDPAEPALPTVPSGRNANFDGENFSSKVVRKLRSLFPVFGKRLPCASLAYGDAAFREAGLLGQRLEHVWRRTAWSNAPRDASLRERLIARPAAGCAAVDAFLTAAGWPQARDKTPVRLALGAWLARQFPSAYLEGLEANLRAGTALLRSYAPRPLVVAETNDLESTMLIASARALGMPVVGLQHGGHYGYIEDHTLAVDLEYSYYDRFVTWGWEALPDWDVCRDVPATPLPCPWLSQRRVHWTRTVPSPRRDPRGKTYDVFLLTNKIYRFPPAPSGAAVCRSDRAVELRTALATFAREASVRGLSILHKPYTVSTTVQLRGAFADMAKAAGPLYRELPPSGKGLTPERVLECGVIVWDQPGTGFLECLAAGLPSMCLWPRIYNEEEPRRAGSFKALERTGLIHREPAALTDEILRFKSDPAGWIGDPARKAAAATFSREFGWADDAWRGQWDSFFRSLTP